MKSTVDFCQARWFGPIKYALQFLMRHTLRTALSINVKTQNFGFETEIAALGGVDY